MELSSFVRPICLPKQPKESLDQKEIWFVAGWGKSSRYESKMSPALQELAVRYFDMTVNGIRNNFQNPLLTIQQNIHCC